MAAPVRIATDSANNRYVVVQVNFRDKEVIVRGEVVEFTANRRTGQVVRWRAQDCRTLKLEDVKISSVAFDAKLLSELLKQAERNKPAPKPLPEGHVRVSVLGMTMVVEKEKAEALLADQAKIVAMMARG